jgi:hypothetical protein
MNEILKRLRLVIVIPAFKKKLDITYQGVLSERLPMVLLMTKEGNSYNRGKGVGEGVAHRHS